MDSDFAMNCGLLKPQLVAQILISLPDVHNRLQILHKSQLLGYLPPFLPLGEISRCYPNLPRIARLLGKASLRLQPISY